MCIQDPFVLNHNVAGNVNEKMRAKIVNEFQRAASVCDRIASQPEISNLLSLLEDETEDFASAGPSDQIQLKNTSDKLKTTLLNQMDKEHIVTFLVETEVNKVPNAIRLQCCSSACVSMKWRHDTVHKLLQSLEEILHFHCALMTANNDAIKSCHFATEANQDGLLSVVRQNCVVCGKQLNDRRIQKLRELQRQFLSKTDELASVIKENVFSSKKRRRSCSNSDSDIQNCHDSKRPSLVTEDSFTSNDSNSSDVDFDSCMTSAKDFVLDTVKNLINKEETICTGQTKERDTNLDNNKDISKEESSKDDSSKDTAKKVSNNGDPSRDTSKSQSTEGDTMCFLKYACPIFNYRMQSLDFHCETVKRLWIGRKLTFKELKVDEKRVSSYDIELAISNKLLEQEELLADSSVGSFAHRSLNFYMSLEPQLMSIDNQQQSALCFKINLIPLAPAKECYAFFGWLKPFLLRVVSKYLYSQYRDL